jgi:hypothetical protein
MSQLSEDLVAQAHVLATMDAARPKAANLRRALSSAYYAVFHHLIDGASQLLAGTQDTDWPFVALTARAFAHGEMRAACRALRNAQPPEVMRPLWAQYRPHQNAEIAILADNFVQLQERRHSADYDLNLRLLRAEVLAAVQLAIAAIKAWETLRQNHREVARLAAFAMLLWKPLQGR